MINSTIKYFAVPILILTASVLFIGLLASLANLLG